MQYLWHWWVIVLASRVSPFIRMATSLLPAHQTLMSRSASSSSVCHITVHHCPNISSVLCTGIEAQPTLGARHFCQKIYVWKCTKNARIFHDICPKNRKMPEFYMIFAPKLFFPIFFGGGSLPESLTPSPAPMICGISWNFKDMVQQQRTHFLLKPTGYFVHCSYSSVCGPSILLCLMK